MDNSTLIEFFGHILHGFTQDVSNQYTTDESEFTAAQSFGYSPLESTGREWYRHPVDELIYQEYSVREAVSSGYLASRNVNVSVSDACSTENNEEREEIQQDRDGRGMAWKRLRPSALRTVWNSMSTGASISLLSPTIVGIIYMLFSYISYNTILQCRFSVMRLFPIRVQWVRTLADLCANAIYYTFSFVTFLLLFRPYQMKGVKRKLFTICSLVYCLDGLYRVALQMRGTPYYIKVYYRVPTYVFYIINVSLQLYALAGHFNMRSRKMVASLIGKVTVPTCISFAAAFLITKYVYPAYNHHRKEGKILIALFTPCFGVALKAISRICVQRLWKITHPGYSYVILAPLYLGTAVMSRVLQLDLDRLQSIAFLGVIHGVAEVIERSTMVFIDHICHMLWKRRSAPWGSFRTPRRERLTADIAIMSMLFESTAIVSVNGFLCWYQFVYLKNHSVKSLLQKFAVATSVPLVIEWFFTSVSLAIETHYQNMAVMAVWRRRWKRHILVAIVNAVPVAIWTSANLIVVVYGRFNVTPKQPCKMPFS